MNRENQMGWMYLVTAMLTGCNLLIRQPQLLTIIWGAVFAVFFVGTNHLAAKHRFMIGGIWFGGAIVVSVLMLAGYQLNDDMQYLVSVFAFFASLLYSIRYFRKS